jgi:hypothetical protein
MWEMMCAVLVWIVAIFLFGALIMIVAARQRQAFEEQFPPISDEEFVARCRPGTNPQIALKVRAIVADQLGVEYARIYPSSSFVEDLGAD